MIGSATHVAKNSTKAQMTCCDLCFFQILVGVGLPLESTGAIEALSHGCVFLNVRYVGNQTNVLQKEGKPTGRKVSCLILSCASVSFDSKA